MTGGTYYRTYTNYGTAAPTGRGRPGDGEHLPAGQVPGDGGAVPSVRGGVEQRRGWLPPAGSGKHTHLNGGLGLANSGAAGTYETGWVATDDSRHRADGREPGLLHVRRTTRGRPSAGDAGEPADQLRELVGGVRVLHLGRRLPAERSGVGVRGGGREPAARVPVGRSADPGTGNQYAIYGCYYPNGTGSCTGVTNIAPVGTATLGAGSGASSTWPARSGSGTSTGTRSYVVSMHGLRLSFGQLRPGGPGRRLRRHVVLAPSVPQRLLPVDPRQLRRLPVREDSVMSWNPLLLDASLSLDLRSLNP